MERAKRVLELLSEIGASSGETRFNPAQGRLMYTTSVDMSMSAANVGSMLAA